MRQQRGVQSVTADFPLRQQPVEDLDKPVFVAALKYVHHFMHDDVFETLGAHPQPRRTLSRYNDGKAQNG